jgi:hypothetical protein
VARGAPAVCAAADAATTSSAAAANVAARENPLRVALTILRILQAVRRGRAAAFASEQRLIRFSRSTIRRPPQL